VNLSSEELLQFFTELQGLVRAGVTLGPELDLRAGSDSRRVRRLWSEILPALERGTPFSEALRGRVPQISESTLALIRAGEESGDLLGALEVVAQGHRRRVRLDRTLHLVMIYPLVVIIFLLAILIFFGLHIIPVVEELAAHGHGAGYTGRWWAPWSGPQSRVPESPMLSGGIYGLCRAMATPAGLGMTLIFAATLVWLALGGLWLRPWIQRRLLAWTPVVGHLMNLGALSRWAHTAGHLLRRRVGIDTALALAESTLELPRLQRESTAVRAQVESGVSLSMALMSRRLMPRPAAGLLSQGEQRGDLDVSLVRLADHMEERLDYHIRKFEAWLEPVLILFVGAVVITVVVNLYVPLAQLQGL
jgi:type IV pilus assembly protein PilC